MKNRIQVEPGHTLIPIDEFAKLRELVFKKYKLLGGNFLREKFGTSSGNDAYNELRFFIHLEILKIITIRKSEILIDKFDLTIDDKTFSTKNHVLKEIINPLLPTNSYLKTVLSDEIEERKRQNFDMEGLYLFATGLTRKEYITIENKKSLDTESPRIISSSNSEFLKNDEILDRILRETVASNKHCLQFIALFASNASEKTATDQAQPKYIGYEVVRAKNVRYLLLLQEPETKVDHLCQVGLRLTEELWENSEGQFKSLGQGQLKRIIYDFEQGGLIFYKIIDSYSLVAANFRQTEMENFEKVVEELHGRLEVHFGLGVGPTNTSKEA